MPRLRPFQPIAQPSKAVPAPAATSGKLDLWLQRISLVAQPLLLVVALLTIKLTVIPLYKMAQLDETLAQRELELKRTNVKLAANYRKLRGYITHNFGFAAWTKCAYTDAEMAWMRTPPGEEFDVSLDVIQRDKLKADVAECVRRLANESTRLDELTDADRQALTSAIESIGKEIAPIKAKAAAEYDAAPALARLNPSRYLGSNTAKMEALMRRLGVEVPAEDIQAAALNAIRRDIMQRYTRETVDVMQKHLEAWAKQELHTVEAGTT